MTLKELARLNYKSSTECATAFSISMQQYYNKANHTVLELKDGRFIIENKTSQISKPFN
jgi:hypothetical protein